MKMKKKNQNNLYIALGMLILFVLWTLSVRFLDVQKIGPNGSSVGFAVLNESVHRFTGVHMLLYVITDWLGLVPLCFAFGFALLGLFQMIQRKSLFRVDRSILMLGGFYILVIAAYLLFEAFPINYRPVLIDGYLEDSYPSSTTMLVMCIIPTAMMQLKARIHNEAAKKAILGSLAGFTGFMVIGRLISGVHWFTDIVGAVLFSAGLVILYGFSRGLSATES